jgi:hypothetical protein
MTGHPFGFVRWRFTTQGVNNNAAVNLDLFVIPAETFPN